jgi:hypothetical protein
VRAFTDAESLLGSVFISRWRKSLAQLRALRSKEAAEFRDRVFFSTLPVTWRLWSEVLGPDRLRDKVRREFGLRADHPAVLITEEDALEFCRLLTARLRAEGLIDETWEVSPPRVVELTFAEKAGLSGAPSSEKGRFGIDPGNSALREAIIRNDAIVRQNIRDYAGVPGDQLTVYRGMPNDLGIVLGQVSTWTSEESSAGRRSVAGPNFRQCPELVRGESWPLPRLSPTDFDLPDLDHFPFLNSPAWFPGKATTLAITSYQHHIGLYVTLRRASRPPAGLFGPVARNRVAPTSE